MPYTISAPPYFDDFDNSKNFQSVLFKPGLAVQTRELNQMQTIQQSQIERFGNSIYKSGSIVTGGEKFVNDKLISLKLLDSYNGLVNVTPLLGYFAKGRTSGTVGEIMMAIPKDGIDPNTLVYQIRNTGINGGLFSNAELIDIFTNQSCTTAYGVTVQAATGSSINATGQCVKDGDRISLVSSVGIAIGDRVSQASISAFTYVYAIVGNDIFVTTPLSVAIASTTFIFYRDNSQPTVTVSISEGVYFVNGYFVHVDQQTIILDKYNKTPSYIIGLYHNYTIVTSDDDPSLLDNASGEYNYAAPGADRLKIPLILTKHALIDNSVANLVSDNFFEIMRIQNGKILQQTNKPIYSELQTTMSRRTFEESGNFLVRPFLMHLTPNAADTTQMVAEITEGKAYVRGNEIEKISSTKVNVARALATETALSFDVSSFYGSYIKVSAPTVSLPQIGSGLSVELHNATTGYSTSTKIGTANIRYMAYDSGTGTGIVYRLFLFNITMTGSNTFSSVKSCINSATAGVYTTITMKMDVNSIGISSGSTILFDSGYSSLLFDIPQTYISTVAKAQYNSRRVFKNVSFSSGIATISGNSGNEQFLGGSGIIAPTNAIQYYSVVATTASGTFTAGAFIPMDGSGRSVTIPTLGAGVAGQAQINLNDSTFNGLCDIEATLFLSNDVRRTKTLVSSFNKAITTPTSVMSLAKSDVVRIVGIYSSGNVGTAATIASTDVTNRYNFFTGQKDTFYDHGSISLKVGQVAPVGQMLVVFDYFTHSGLGYLCVNSYGVSYDNIPTYTDSTGQLRYLRDCLDFRPRRIDDNIATTTFQNFQLSEPTFVEIDQSYYMSRIDKIIMTSAGDFKVIQGISSFKNPQPPSDFPDAMTLYTLVLSAYTLNANMVKVIYENNRRYTMNDIAKIDQRLGNVEYYTALNSLEQTVNRSTLTNTSGVVLFKNGFLTEPFADFTVADVGHSDFKCSIDSVQNYARAPYKISNTALVWNQTGTTSRKTGDLVTAPYTEVPFVTQNLASKYVNVNPYNVFSNIGVLKLTPSSDIWYDTNTLPTITVSNANSAAFLIAQQNANIMNQQSQWGAWNTTWTGSTTSDGFFWTEGENSSINFSAGSTTTTTNQVRYKTSSTVTSNNVTSADTKIVSKDTIPFIRESDVKFSATGLTPYAVVYAYIDGIDVSSFVTPTNLSLGSPITCDINGAVSGNIHIPNNSAYRFICGSKNIVLGSNATVINSSSFASGIYLAQGYINNTQTTITSTRTPVTVTNTLSDTRTLTTITSPPVDPVAETFFVDITRNPLGVFVSSVDLFFASKDSENPITIEIRPTVNGYPSSSMIFPFSQVTINPSQINISVNGTVATNCVFPSPVFLTPGEYAIVIKSNSDNYNVFVAEMGKPILGQNKAVTNQPYIGAFFQSQNASTWTANQDLDLCFVLYKCNFAIGTTKFYVNAPTPSTEFDYDILQVTSQELNFGTATELSVRQSTFQLGGSLSGYTPFSQNVDKNFTARQRLLNNSDLSVEYSITTRSPDVSPVVDLERCSAIMVQNVINQPSDWTNAETTINGDAKAKYVSKKVVLASGFDANNLVVYMDVNRPAGTSIQVYYKVQNVFDTLDFYSLPWTLMNVESSGGFTSMDGELVEDKYSAYGVTYTNAGTTYNNFRSFQVKVVMNSSNVSFSPTITDIREIALA